MTIEKGLLLHWWHYYGKHIYTLEELEKFDHIIDQYGTDKVFDAAVAAYICDDGSPTLILSCIRQNCVEEMFEKLPKVEDMKAEEQKQIEAIRERLFQTIQSTYK